MEKIVMKSEVTRAVYYGKNRKTGEFCVSLLFTFLDKTTPHAEAIFDFYII